MLKKVIALSSVLVLTLGTIGTCVMAAGNDNNHYNSSYYYYKSGNVSGFNAYSSTPPSGELAVTGCMCTNGSTTLYIETIVRERSSFDGTVINYNDSSITTNSGGTGVNIPRNRTDSTVYYEHSATASPSSYPSYHIDGYSYTARQEI